jgi:hypothetical protein
MATASFITQDLLTIGTWPGVYGTSGRGIANDGADASATVTVTVTQGSTFTWDGSPTANRALRKRSGAGRIASVFFHSSIVKLTAASPSGINRLRLYLLDWDNTGRAATVNVYDHGTNGLLHTQAIPTATYQAGVWLTWEISGTVRVEIVMTAGGNTGFSGWFVDDGPTPTATSPLLTGALLGQIAGGTTPPIDTTTAALLVLNVSWLKDFGDVSSVSDSKANSWSPLTQRVSSGLHAQRFWYTASPTVGAGHTFTVSGTGNFYAALVALAFRDSLPFDVETGATGSATPPLATGSLTPSGGGALIVSGFAGNTNLVTLAASGLTVVAIEAWPNTVTGAVGYVVQSSVATVNPSWTWSGSDPTGRGTVASVAAFRSSSAAVARAEPFIWLPV